MRWQKAVVPMQVNGMSSVTSYTTRLGEYVMQVLDAGGGVSESLSSNEVEHFIIGICKPQEMYSMHPAGKEPTYSQKLQVLKELGKWKEVALEVMPPEFEVVDIDDVYHIWEFQYINSFCVNVNPILRKPASFEQSYRGIEYHIEQEAMVRYVYFKTDGKLPWREKQKLKNHIATEVGTAVEIICSAMECNDYGCLIVLPPWQFLDFGLE